MNNLNEIQLLPNKSIIKNLQLWLSFRNDFITIEKFAEYYGLDLEDARWFVCSMRAVTRKYSDKSLLQIFGLVTHSGEQNVLKEIPLFEGLTIADNCRAWIMFDDLINPLSQVNRAVDIYLSGWRISSDEIDTVRLDELKKSVTAFLECMTIIKAILPDATPQEIFQIEGV